jgi:hypothetical protein
MTKSQQIAQLLLQPNGCTVADILAATGWPSVSVAWHARNNGLRLKVIEQRPHRYFGYKPAIKIRDRISPAPAIERKIFTKKRTKPLREPLLPMPLPRQQRTLKVDDFCRYFTNGAAIKILRENKTLKARCSRCYLTFCLPNQGSISIAYAKEIWRHGQYHRGFKKESPA